MKEFFKTIFYKQETSSHVEPSKGWPKTPEPKPITGVKLTITNPTDIKNILETWDVYKAGDYKSKMAEFNYLKAITIAQRNKNVMPFEGGITFIDSPKIFSELIVLEGKRHGTSEHPTVFEEWPVADLKKTEETTPKKEKNTKKKP